MKKKIYKADSPINTIRKIRAKIIQLGIPFEEINLGNGEMFCSCRITITRDTDNSIGTNGKGMNTDFARASGYAEFMERLQNRANSLSQPATIGASCRFYPDEKEYHWTHDNAEIQIKRFVPRAFSLEAGLRAQKIEGKSIPFYHVNTEEIVDLPYSLIRWTNGSNGMCAGNIREEALIQGFNEIFERYCIQEMYLLKNTPPIFHLLNLMVSEVFETPRICPRYLRHGFSRKGYLVG